MIVCSLLNCVCDQSKVSDVFLLTYKKQESPKWVIYQVNESGWTQNEIRLILPIRASYEQNYMYIFIIIDVGIEPRNAGDFLHAKMHGNLNT